MKYFCWVAYGIAWIATAFAVSVGLYYTHNIWCLIFLFVPTFVTIKEVK